MGLFAGMMQAGKLAVALMAGGKSTRMGRDKCGISDRDGRELWRGRLELLRELKTSEVLISCRADQTDFDGSGARLVFDQWENAGPLGGIVSCLEAMEADRLLVLGVDLPAMTRVGLDALVDVAETGGSVFRCGGMLEPLVAVYPKSMASAGRRRLQAGDFAMRGWIAEAGNAMRELVAPVEWCGLFLNLNDPASWARWLDEAQNRA